VVIVKLSPSVMEGLKGVLAHNTAQILLNSKAEAVAYLDDAQALFTTLEIDGAQVKELIVYATMKSRHEVKMIRDMYKRYGIQANVSGHGGSQVSLQTLLEIAISKE
jgi:hypothetical protein